MRIIIAYCEENNNYLRILENVSYNYVTTNSISI